MEENGRYRDRVPGEDKGGTREGDERRQVDPHKNSRGLLSRLNGGPAEDMGWGVWEWGMGDTALER